jgi:uncharacterized RDD family membrane protein YckC
MIAEDTYVDDVLSYVPQGASRMRIEMDLRAHIAERIEQGQPIEEAIRQFGDPRMLAESYLVAVPLESADFITRTVAKLIDFAAIGAAVTGLAWSIWWLLGSAGLGFADSHPTVTALFVPVCVLTFVLILPAYFAFAEYLTDQTLGKRLLGIRVVRESGTRITFGQSLVRQIPLAASIFLLDALFALFTENNQRAFELISKTRTVLVDDDSAQ